ncbi:hypothetical protein [Brachybacterium sp. FME24]|uniref:hypothetical protein n=1 Tax=Brachybacterium sp. FME24 TaxID=2742605 RepID=UPI001865E56C|nr:hypothetical protein [Brachybacterium sp. FME24]
MEDEISAASCASAELSVQQRRQPLGEEPVAEHRGLRERTTAGAATLGASALLVLSFGPAALALSPSDLETAAAEDKAWISPLDGASPVAVTPPRSEEESSGL